MQKQEKITKTLAHEYSSESTQRELSNEYQLDQVSKIFTSLCLQWTKVASALEGLKVPKCCNKIANILEVNAYSQNVKSGL